ncbi:MAG: peptide chain release factor 2 [Chloroflexi bacterium]|nr:peptide chain release factor 2 [Chloroflexota bacterium]
MQETRARLEALGARISDILVRLDVASKEQEAAVLERGTAQDGFWDDPQQAQEVMRRLSELKEEAAFWRAIERRAADALGLLRLALEEESTTLAPELEEEATSLERLLEEQELRLAFRDPYAKRNAVLAIHAGAGGTEAQDWAQMLLRMYLRWAEQRRYHPLVVDVSPGEEAGIKSVVVEVEGRYAYGYLKGERGVHRLVRLSPYDYDHARHTSFALVEVMPEAEETGEVVIDPGDLRIDVFRASGAGGQNVQKNATAVRITHLPTNIIVSCQNERSQLQNREVALRILRARLIQRELEQQQAEQAKLKGEYITAGWGNQIRSYVLHPYKMVKDLRTGYETSDANAVLEGDLDDLIRAYLQSTVGEE